VKDHNTLPVIMPVVIVWAWFIWSWFNIFEKWFFHVCMEMSWGNSGCLWVLETGLVWLVLLSFPPQPLCAHFVYLSGGSCIFCVGPHRSARQFAIPHSLSCTVQCSVVLFSSLYSILCQTSVVISSHVA
jgi:hypothetical protein